MRSKILVAAAVVALGFFAIASGSALAAPGGKGGGGGKGGKTTTPTCTLAVTPNPAPQQTNIVLTGSRFTPTTQLNIVQDGVVFWMYSSSDGTITMTLWSGMAGSHNIVAKQLVSGSYVQCGSVTYQAY